MTGDGRRAVALIRDVSPRIGECQLTHVERRPIDVERAAAQHREYVRVLERLGLEVRRLPSEPDLPDAVFVEDTAVILDALAVMCRPGAESRRPELRTVEEVLAEYRAIARIEAPGTLDGGDVLRAGKRLFAGRSSRTNADGIAQLGRMTAASGHEVSAVDVTGCLHLKTACCYLGRGVLLGNRRFVDPAAFPGLAWIDVDQDEPPAANALAAGGAVIVAAGSPRTRRWIEAAGFQVVEVDNSELAKAEGGVTCCCLLVER